MKFIIALSIALMGVSTAQAYNTYDVRDYSCSELKQTLNNEGVIELIYQSFFGGTGLHFADRDDCGQCYRPISANVKSNTGWCHVGYKCQKNTKITDKKNKNHKEKKLAKYCKEVWKKGLLN